jgi:hypothetical protein
MMLPGNGETDVRSPSRSDLRSPDRPLCRGRSRLRARQQRRRPLIDVLAPVIPSRRGHLAGRRRCRHQRIQHVGPSDWTPRVPAQRSTWEAAAERSPRGAVTERNTPPPARRKSSSPCARVTTTPYTRGGVANDPPLTVLGMTIVCGTHDVVLIVGVDREYEEAEAGEVRRRRFEDPGAPPLSERMGPIPRYAGSAFVKQRERIGIALAGSDTRSGSVTDTAIAPQHRLARRSWGSRSAVHRGAPRRLASSERNTPPFAVAA